MSADIDADERMQEKIIYNMKKLLTEKGHGLSRYGHSSKAVYYFSLRFEA